MQCPTSNLLVFESDKLDEHLSALEGDQPVAHFGLKALNDVLGGVYPGLNYAIGTAPGKRSAGPSLICSRQMGKSCGLP